MRSPIDRPSHPKSWVLVLFCFAVIFTLLATPLQRFKTSAQNKSDAREILLGTPEIAPPAPLGCTPNTVIFTNATVVAIPTGPAVATSTITVVGPPGNFLYDVDVIANITHTGNADIDMTVESPGGRIVTLTTDNGGTNDNVFANTTWDDDADPNGQVPFATSGGNPGSASDNPYANLINNPTLTPEEPLAAFIGTPVVNGDWTLTISDDMAVNGGSLNGWSLVLTYLTASPTTAAVSGSNPTDFPIPDTSPGSVASTITIPDGGSILDVNVTTNITHGFASDLQFTLTHQATGTVVTLISNQPDFNAVGANFFTNTTFDDSANATLGQVPYTNNPGLATDHPYINGLNVPQLAPVEALGAFIGEDAAGNWILTVADSTAPDAGLLTGWSINITIAACLTAANVSLGGRVTTAGGNGISNARVTVVGGPLTAPRTVLTSGFGYYSFEDLPAGQTYIVTVGSKRFTFAVPSRPVVLVDSIGDFDFVAEPQE